ncbi:MAG TPA: UdgX family uracil-DNA binding protein [Myxococcota bacterium]|nr:UdgX family uracil-DNA binding protein [Myxococcota bacterium]
MARRAMVESSAADFLPPARTLESLRAAAQRCRGCDLYRNATQAVMGEGPARARLVLVGEQPGNQEDRQGRPFVGPAGKLLDRALAEAGFARSDAYLTNAVKHFKWRPRGRLRIHARPDAREIRACRPWFEAELEAIEPDAVVALGATAAQALFGPSARVTVQRGRVFASPWARCSAMTVHPSALLRIPEEEERHRAFAELVRDLKAVKRALESAAPKVISRTAPTRKAARARRS